MPSVVLKRDHTRFVHGQQVRLDFLSGATNHEGDAVAGKTRIARERCDDRHSRRLGEQTHQRLELSRVTHGVNPIDRPFAPPSAPPKKTSRQVGPAGAGGRHEASTAKYLSPVFAEVA